MKFDECITLPNPSIKSVADIDAIVLADDSTVKLSSTDVSGIDVTSQLVGVTDKSGVGALDTYVDCSITLSNSSGLLVPVAFQVVPI